MASCADADGDCPRCGRALRLRRGQHLRAKICVRCGGAWLSRDEITDMLRDETLPKVEPESLFAERQYAPADLSLRDLRCPSCGRAMQAKSFEPGAVLLDVCAAHGVWFDRHELRQVVQSEVDRRQRRAVDRDSALDGGSVERRPAADAAPAEGEPGSLFGPPLEGQLESGLLYALGHLLRLLG